MTALQDMPISSTQPHTSLWREEGGTSMRALGYFIGAFVIALLLGIGSAWYMIDQGSILTTTRIGPWKSWLSEANPNADPYTRAHLARSGRLPLTSTAARYFYAQTDSSGGRLSASCEYLLTGAPINARWWSIALYDSAGSVIKNPSNRYSFNSEEAIRRSDGSYEIHIAQNARPGNWLPAGDDASRSLSLLLRVYGTRDTDSSGIGQIPPKALPKIELKRCE